MEGPSVARHVLFLGDIRGTKSGLEAVAVGDGAALEDRVAMLQDAFAHTFMDFRPRSRSLMAITLSDSVVAYWTDVKEGARFGIDFMTTLWRRLDRERLSFRGFLEVGAVVREASVLAQTLADAEQRFVMALPASVASWSVSVAEGCHFKEGLYVSTALEGMVSADLESGIETAGAFRYRRLRT